MTNDAQAVDPTFPWKGLLLLIGLGGFALFRSYLGTRLDSVTSTNVPARRWHVLHPHG